jgi:hypothetical protein
MSALTRQQRITQDLKKLKGVVDMAAVPGGGGGESVPPGVFNAWINLISSLEGCVALLEKDIAEPKKSKTKKSKTKTKRRTSKK